MELEIAPRAGQTRERRQGLGAAEFAIFDLGARGLRQFDLGCSEQRCRVALTRRQCMLGRFEGAREYHGLAPGLPDTGIIFLRADEIRSRAGCLHRPNSFSFFQVVPIQLKKYFQRIRLYRFDAAGDADILGERSGGLRERKGTQKPAEGAQEGFLCAEQVRHLTFGGAVNRRSAVTLHSDLER